MTNLTPPVIIWLREDNVSKLFAMFLAGELDALVTLYNSEVMASTVGREVKFEKLAEEHYVVIGPLGHRLANGRAVSWQTLSEARWVFTRKPALSRALVDDSFKHHGVDPPMPVCETDGPVTAAKLVASGVGLSVVPEMTAQDYLRSMSVSLIKLQAPLRIASLGIVYRLASVEHPRIAFLREALRSSARLNR